MSLHVHFRDPVDPEYANALAGALARRAVPEVGTFVSGPSGTLFRVAEVRRVLALDAEFKESEHPRGQPGNAGQFGPGGGGPLRGQKAAATRSKNAASAKTEASRLTARAKVDAIVNAAEGYDPNVSYKRDAGTLPPARINKPRPLTFDETHQIGGIVADHLGWDANKLSVSDEAKKFTLNDQQMDYAGSADLKTGVITLYTSALHPSTVAPVMAHEVMHQKFQSVFDAYRAEKDRMKEDTGDDLDLYDKMLRPDDTLRDEYKEKYPIYNRIHPSERGVKNLLSVSDLAPDDGITDYSREWWSAFNTGATFGLFRVDAMQTIHETLAEMARLDWEGSLPRMLWYKESKSWKPLYEALNDIYPTLSKKT